MGGAARGPGGLRGVLGGCRARAGERADTREVDGAQGALSLTPQCGCVWGRKAPSELGATVAFFSPTLGGA